MENRIRIYFTIFLLMMTLGLSCGKGGDAVKEKKPETGETAPDFSLKNHDQANVRLSDFRGKKNVILVFYPLDFTPV